MRGASTGLLFFAAAVLILSLVFAWRTTRTEDGWDPGRVVLDTSRFHRYEPRVSQEANQSVWMEKMAKLTQPVRFPADESTLNWDLVDPEFRKNVVLVLRFDSLDRFQRRCLDIFLQSRRIDHMIDEREQIDVRLKTKEEASARLLIEELAAYDLTPSLVVLRETKPY